MSLKPKMANTLKLDENGYAIGKILDIRFIDADESDYEREQYEFLFECEGTKKPINLRYWTGTLINGDNYSNNNDYNKLTRLLIQLELISESQIKQAYKEGEELMIDIEGLIGVAVRFKPAKSAKIKGLSQIDPMSLELVKPSKIAVAV